MNDMERAMNPFNNPPQPSQKPEEVEQQAQPEAEKQEQENAPPTPEERLSYIEFMSELSSELGFVETDEMLKIRNDQELWKIEGAKIIDTAGKNSELRKKLYIGNFLTLASIAYEKNDQREYEQNIKSATNTALSGGFFSLADKIFYTESKRENFEKERTEILVSLGYTVIESGEEGVKLEKNGYSIDMKDFMKRSVSGINEGSVVSIEMKKEQKTLRWDYKTTPEGVSEVEQEMYDELLDNFS